MSYQRLDSIADVLQGGRHRKSGKHFTAEGFPAFGAGGLNGYLPFCEFKRRAVVLSSIGARCGKCFLTPERWTSLANTQVIDVDETKADVRFLWYQLNDEEGWIRRGTAQPYIRPSDVKSRKVYLPPLPEQQRIANILDKADEIRRKRQQAIAHTDELLRSVFLDMFGDPENTTTTIDELCQIKGGKRLPKGASYTDGPTPHPYIRVVDFESMTVRDDDLRYISQQLHEQISRYTISSDDVYISIAGTIGRVGLVPRHLSGANLTENAAKLVLKDDRVTKEFLAHFLAADLGQQQIATKTMATSQPKLALFRIGELRVPLADQEDQCRFAKLAAEIGRLRDHAAQAKRDADMLLASLTQRAFAGEL